MRQRLAGWLTRLAAWIAGDVVTLLVANDALLLAAKNVSASLDHKTETGEWKRHQVYALLLKEFPDRSKRDVALAIEAAVMIL